jgi:HAD superfamily hydrolase (TIGR01509 family)
MKAPILGGAQFWKACSPRGAHLQALIFDVDGTLADTEETHRQAFNTAFGMHTLDWVWSTDLYAELLQVAGGKERIGHHVDCLDLASAEKARLKALIPVIHRTKTRVFTELVQSGRVAPRAGIRRLIMEARAERLRLAIASTTSAENVAALLYSSFGRDSLTWFSAIATGDVVAHKKPAPDIYLRTLDLLELAPASAIAIEDSEIGVLAAKAAGLVTIATPTRWTSAQDFAAADLLLPSLGDPANPLAARDVRRRIGAPYLDVNDLIKLHATATNGLEPNS